MAIRHIMALAAVLLASCTADADKPGSGAGKNDELERFNAVILKSDMLGLAGDAILQSADKDDLCYRLSFSDGTQMTMGLHYSALVTTNADDMITINGKDSGHRIIDIPYYTISPEGKWIKDGIDTGTAAIPECPASLLEGGPVLRYMMWSRKGAEAFFSDGSTMSFCRKAVNDMYVSKSASRMDVYMGERGDSVFVCYPFKKRFRTYEEGRYPCFLDNWGVGALKFCDRTEDGFGKGTEVFLNGEAEMALKVTDGKDSSQGTYVGGTLHGFEQIAVEGDVRQLSISVDGVPVQENETFAMRQAGKIVITQESLLYQAYTTTEPFARAYRTWTFEDGRLTIDITLDMLREMYCHDMMFGMLCVLRRWEGNSAAPYITRYAVKDNVPDTVHDLQDGWTGGIGNRDSGTRKITEYGEMGWSFALAVDESSHGGGMFVGTNGNAYNKIYFDMAHNYSAAAGERFHGRVHWEIERTR